MKIALIVSLLVASLALNAEMLRGKVVCVADWDTITILDATNTQNKVRLNKIDALYGKEKKNVRENLWRKWDNGGARHVSLLFL